MPASPSGLCCYARPPWHRHQRGRRAHHQVRWPEHGQARKVPGFSADLAGAANLLLATLTGIPVSSTHIKTCAIMGVGAVKRLSAINFGVVKDMMFTWFFTFPACGLISFVMAKLFMMFI